MGLYEELYERHNRIANLDIKSMEDIKSLLFMDLSRVRVLKNVLREIIPFHEVVGNKEIEKVLQVLNRWEKRLTEKVEH